MSRSDRRDRALALAQAEAKARGHPWREPVSVHRTLRHYVVRANTRSRGGSIRVTLDRGATRVVQYWIPPGDLRGRRPRIVSLS